MDEASPELQKEINDAIAEQDKLVDETEKDKTSTLADDIMQMPGVIFFDKHPKKDFGLFYLCYFLFVCFILFFLFLILKEIRYL